MTRRIPSPPSAGQVVTKLLELGVFVPVGLLEAARAELPKFAARGRQTVEQRVLVGRFIATVVAQQARQRVETFVHPADRSERGSHPTPDAPPAPSAPRAAAEPEVGTVETALDLPIEQYESLSATQVIPLLAGLSPDELEAIDRFERRHRNRRTVLGRIEQLKQR
jgi:hypothetical protein